MTAPCHQPRATRSALLVADSGSDRYCQRTFFEVRSQSSLTRSPVSSEVWTTSRSVGVSQELDRRSDS